MYSQAKVMGKRLSVVDNLPIHYTSNDAGVCCFETRKPNRWDQPSKEAYNFYNTSVRTIQYNNHSKPGRDYNNRKVHKVHQLHLPPFIKQTTDMAMCN